MNNRKNTEENSNENMPKKKSIFQRAVMSYVKLLLFVLFLLIVATLVVIVIQLFTKEPTIEIDEAYLSELTEIAVPQTSNEDLSEGSEETVPEEINPNEQKPDIKIVFNLIKNQQLPKPYSTSNAIYRDCISYSDFASDSPDYTDISEKIIVIDPGHQDSSHTEKTNIWLSPYLDPSKSDSWVLNHYQKIGATGVATGKSEYEITHAIAKKLKLELENRGYTVYLTKDSASESLYGADRAAIANKKNAKLMISLHCDAYTSDSSVRGALAQTPAYWDGYPDKNLVSVSYSAAQLILDKYTAVTGLKNRGVQQITSSSLFSFCKVPCILLEMGFLSNREEDKLLNTVDFQKSIVKGISDGIDSYFEAVSTNATGK